MNTAQKNKNILIKKDKTERGIALILTLGILSLLLVLGIGFAMNSITDQQAASNSNDLALARMLAESAFQRAMAAMKWKSEAGAANYDDVISHNENASDPNRKTNDWICNLGTQLDGVTYCDTSILHINDPTNSEAVHWQYIYEDPAAKDKIIGRLAYIVLSNKGRLDPSACVDTGAVNPSPPNENGANEARIGVNIREINIQNLDPFNTTGFLSASDVSNFSADNASPTGKLSHGNRWVDMESMFSAMGITNPAQKAKYREWFVVDEAATSEAFWIDVNNDGVKDSGELYHRFNLARTNWDDLDEDGTDDSTQSGDTITGYILSSPQKYSEAYDETFGTGNAGGIKWLKDFGKNAAGGDIPSIRGTFSSVDAKRKQIAANLIDYCDSDIDVTSDVPPANWQLSTPHYTGLELTPYINEIGIEVSFKLSGPDPSGKYDLKMSVNLGCEVINMYGENFSSTTQLYLTWQINDNTTLVDNGSNTITLTPVSTNKYKFLWQNIISDKSLGLISTSSYTFNRLKVQITKAILSYNGKNIDYAAPDTSSEWSEEKIITVSSGGGTSTAYFAYEIDDPRQNLNPDDWPQGKANDGSYTGTPGTVNNNVTIHNYPTPVVTYDKDQATDPADCATAYIRNGPMQSPWELGCIHRAEKWQTLNLTCYNTGVGVRDKGGGGNLYQYGDANILDQIKMSPATKVYGKVNLNTDNSDVLRALLMNISVGSGYHTPGISTADVIDKTKADNIVTDIKNFNGTTGGTPLKTRAQIANVAKLSDDTEISRDNNAEQEEVIGKFINLTTAEEVNTFTIIAIGQTIKDIGTQNNGNSNPNDGSVTINKDLDASGSIGNANETVCHFDINGDGDTNDTSISETISGCELGSYNQYGDEILSEAKIMAVVQRYLEGGVWKWKILRYEYLSE